MADDLTPDIVWLKTMPEWIDLVYALRARGGLFGQPEATSLDRAKADARVANMAVRLADALPPLIEPDRLTAPVDGRLDVTTLPEWEALVEAVNKAGGRMGARWMLPVGDRAIALVGASRRLAAADREDRT